MCNFGGVGGMAWGGLAALSSFKQMSEACLKHQQAGPADCNAYGKSPPAPAFSDWLSACCDKVMLLGSILGPFGVFGRC